MADMRRNDGSPPPKLVELDEGGLPGAWIWAFCILGLVTLAAPIIVGLFA